MLKNKIVFYLIFFALLALVPLTILNLTPISIATPYLVARLALRMLGLTAFILLFVQIILGLYMEKFVNKLGPWIFNFHVIEGISAYIIIFFHPIIYAVSNHLLGKPLDPIGIFLGFCLLCKPKLELYYTFGRIGFWLLTVGVTAGLLRKITPWLRANWRNFHELNYVAFLIISFHGFFGGTDFRIQPFYSFAIISYVIILYIVLFKKLPVLLRNYLRWIKS